MNFKNQTILVTGGAGYIGSHTVLQLLEADCQVIVFDNYSNSSPESLKRVSELTGKTCTLIEGDLCDPTALARAFSNQNIDGVIHFAGLKAVGESVAQPRRYYQNNVAGTCNLLDAMAEARVKTLVFSSSATVYGNPDRVPISEDFPLAATNPYGRSKLMIEDILRDLSHADPSWHIALLRYFNPIGAHESGRIGEDPAGLPNNLLPYIAQVAVGKLPELGVFGDDYPTSDGTGVRDYIHVVDIADGHLKALEALDSRPGLMTVNLGTGQGYSVLETIKAFEKASGLTIPYSVKPRRPGDVAECYADPTRAREVLGWSASRDLDAMCADTWRWQSANPEGY